MIVVLILVAGIVLIAGLVWVLYSSARRNKSDETGRRTEVENGPKTPARTEGREP